MQKVRLVDIAQKLGVSTVTVHNALCGQKGVSEEMRARIQKTAEEMGYEHASASRKRNAAERAWKIVVLIAENYLSQDTTYYWKMYQELAAAAVGKSCCTIVEALKKEDEMESLKLPSALREHNVDGMIILGEISRQYIHKLRRYTSLPIVFLDFYYDEIASDAVIADNFYGMYQMTELLFARGIERIAFVGSIHATSSIMDRYCGFMKSMTEHRKTLPDEWLIEDRDEFGNLGFELPNCLPQAFACNCDLIASILIEKLKEAGYRVPEDISVIGFDNFVTPLYADTKVTTYEINMKAMAKAALDKLLKQLRTPGRSQRMEVIAGQIRLKSSIR